MLYSQRIHGDKIRVNENINFIFWEKLIQVFENMHKEDYFSKSYPTRYPSYRQDEYYENLMCDHDGHVYECDLAKLSKDLMFYTGNQLSWPLQATKKADSNPRDTNKSSDKLEDWWPSIEQTFDLIEFLYSKTNTAQVRYSYYMSDYEEVRIKLLLFPMNDNAAKKEFIKRINTLFCDARLIYEFDSELGQIKTILSPETKQLIHSALRCEQFNLDSSYQQTLQKACEKISSSRSEQNYEALRDLWDAFERLKCYFQPAEQSKKKESIEKITNLFSENSAFEKIINEEMKKLSDLGNSFSIRHSETYQETLTNHRQIKYLFNRCLAIIILIQDQIVLAESIKVV